MIRGRSNFVERDFLFVACKVVVGREEQHAMTLLPFPHRHTGTVPKGGFGFSLLVFVVATGTER